MRKLLYCGKVYCLVIFWGTIIWCLYSLALSSRLISFSIIKDNRMDISLIVFFSIFFVHMCFMFCLVICSFITKVDLAIKIKQLLNNTSDKIKFIAVVLFVALNFIYIIILAFNEIEVDGVGWIFSVITMISYLLSVAFSKMIYELNIIENDKKNTITT